MSNDIIKTSLFSLGQTINKNSPTILTALGVGGLLSTIVFAVKDTIKAMEIVENGRRYKIDRWQKQTGEDPDLYPEEVMLTTEDIVRLTWKCYIPTGLMAASTIACVIGANHISLRKNAAITSLFTITDAALKEYQAKVVDTIGAQKEELLRGEIAEKKIKENPPDDKSIILTGRGNYLCFDVFSGRYFRSDIEFLRRNENLFNQKLLRIGWLDINEFYSEIGLDPIANGSEMGWIATYNLMELKFSTKLTPDDEPCLVMDYYVSPRDI